MIQSDTRSSSRGNGGIASPDSGLNEYRHWYELIKKGREFLPLVISYHYDFGDRFMKFFEYACNLQI